MSITPNALLLVDMNASCSGRPFARAPEANQTIFVTAVPVPCGFTRSGLPVGLQLIAPAFQEPLTLQIAHAYELTARRRELRPVVGI